MTEEEIESISLGNMPIEMAEGLKTEDELLSEAIQEKIREIAQTPSQKQYAKISESELIDYLQSGYEIVKELSSGDLIVLG